MSKTFSFILIIILITYIYTSGDSECERHTITSSGRRRIESLDECNDFKTSDDTIYECVTGRGKCEEKEKMTQCVQTKADSRRRLSSDLDCKDQQTTDDSKFICKLNRDMNRCIEMPKSECELTTSESSRRLTTEGGVTEELCKKKKTSDASIYKCVINSQKNGCEEYPISPCKALYGGTGLSEQICTQKETTDQERFKCSYDENANKCDETYKFSECRSKRPSTASRRLSTDKLLTENECKNAKTSDDTKYKCVLSSNNVECEEVNKESSSSLKLSFAILCLLLFI